MCERSDAMFECGDAMSEVKKLMRGVRQLN